MPGRPTLRDPATRAEFMRRIAAGDGKAKACDRVGVDRNELRLMMRDPDFAEEFDFAVDESLEPIFEAMRENAIDGDSTSAERFFKYRKGVPTPEKREKAPTTGRIEVGMDPKTAKTIGELTRIIQGRVAGGLPEGEDDEIIDVEEVPE